MFNNPSNSLIPLKMLVGKKKKKRILIGIIKKKNEDIEAKLPCAEEKEE